MLKNAELSGEIETVCCGRVRGSKHLRSALGGGMPPRRRQVGERGDAAPGADSVDHRKCRDRGF